MTISSVRRAAVAIATAVALVAVATATTTPAGAEPSGGIPGPFSADAASVDLGSGFGCAVMSNGGVRCWGSGDHGDLAQGNTAAIGDAAGEKPVTVPLPGPAVTVATASAGTACAVLQTGQLRCWGNNNSGQLAQGSFGDVGDNPGELPVAVDLGPGRTAAAVTAGQGHFCAITDIGGVRCWGLNFNGQVGQGTNTNVTTSLPVALPRPAVAIAAGDVSTCVILDDGSLRCWGGNTYGQLQQGNPSDWGNQPGEEVPLAVNTNGHRVLAISGGGANFCAIWDDHTLHCWGYSGDGEIAKGRTEAYGDTAGEQYAVGAIDLPPGRSAVQVSVGSRSACAVLDDGSLRCWGHNGDGELGQGSTIANYGATPGQTTLPVDPGEPARAVFVGLSLACATTASGLRCWGLNDEGQLAQGTTIPYGRGIGETPRNLPPIDFGGAQIGRDSDGDGLRDAVDACPTIAGTLPNGCAAPAAAVAPEAVLKGRKVVLDTVLAKKKASAKCPAQAKVTVKTKGKHGAIRATKQLKTRTVATGCRVQGKVRLSAKPKQGAAVKVKVSAQGLVTKRLVAVRP